MRIWPVLLLSGCIWNPDSYRGRDAGMADVGVEDGRTDDASDSGEDAFDSGTDAEIDAPPDVPLMPIDSGTDTNVDAGMCTLTTETGAIVLSEPGMTWGNVELTYGGSGPAIRVTAPNVTIENVALLLTSNRAHGIEVEANNATIRHVRIQSGDVPSAGDFYHRWGVVVEGTAGSRIDQVTLADVSMKGLEGIALEYVDNGGISGLRIEDPAGMGTPTGEPGELGHVGIYVENNNNTSIRNFAITGGPMADLHHGIALVNNRRMTISDGVVAIQTKSRYAFRVSGITTSSPRNEIISVQISDARAGFQFVSTTDWSLMNTKVVRASDCTGSDYAYAVMGAGGSAVCTNCAWGGPCGTDASQAIAVDMDPSDSSITRLPNLNFCFDDEVTF